MFPYEAEKVVLSRSVKNSVGILMRIPLNLEIAFDMLVIGTILILLTHEHWRSFHFLISLIYLFSVLKLLYKSSLGLDLLQDILYYLSSCERDCFHDFFFNLCVICIYESHCFCELILYLAILMKVFIKVSWYNFRVRYVNYHFILRWRHFDFSLSNLQPPDLLQLSYCLEHN